MGLTINYRTPSDVMKAAGPMIRSVRPEANVPDSVRSTGVRIEYGRVENLQRVVADWLAAHSEGVMCVIGAPYFPKSERVRSLTPASAKGLEFDLVVLVNPAAWAMA